MSTESFYQLTERESGPHPLDLDCLNKAQRQAVETTEGPVLALSGAGTGKTRVLTSRIAYLIQTGLARPYEILSLTFTNKAANEMHQRLENFIGPTQAADVWLGTFHAFGLRFLRRYADQIGRAAGFTILDVSDQERLAKLVLAQLKLDIKTYPPRYALGLVQTCKERCILPFQEALKEVKKEDNFPLQRFYTQYQELLEQNNAFDFGDLVLYPVHLMETVADIGDFWQNKFRYILVDEYQDTNIVQNKLLGLLAQKRRNLFCVGDDDQSIYSWRGADIHTLLDFEKNFDNTTLIRLEKNYRSTRCILEAANVLIARNTERLGKNLWTDTEEGHRLEIIGLEDDRQEARVLVEAIDKLHRQEGVAYDDMAILVRLVAQTRLFEEALTQQGIKYRILGGMKFYDRHEIRDIVAYLRIIFSQGDHLAFERIINRPARGVGEQSLVIIQALAQQRNKPIMEAAALAVQEEHLRGKARESVAQFISAVGAWRKEAETMSLDALARHVIDQSGYSAMLEAQKHKDPTAQGRLDNLQELVSGLVQHKSLADFLDHVALFNTADEKNTEKTLSIMTIHGAKGLEFDSVFLPGWEEKSFPHERALEEKAGLEEERRLAYVALTRAKRRLFLSYARSRRLYDQYRKNRPSRFLKELPQTSVAFFGLAAQDILQNRPSPSSEETSEAAPKGPSHNSSVPVFEKGQRVRHPKFGEGVVLFNDSGRVRSLFSDGKERVIIAAFLTKVETPTAEGSVKGFDRDPR